MVPDSYGHEISPFLVKIPYVELPALVNHISKCVSYKSMMHMATMAISQSFI